MTSTYIDTHIKRLALAREAAQLGARHKFVAELSCLPYRDVARLFTRAGRKVPRGVPPQRNNWAHAAPLLCRVEAAIFCGLYERLRLAGNGASVSMVAAYREFARNYQPMIHDQERIQRAGADTLTFNRAFHLVANLRLSCPPDPALWLRSDPRYSLVTCRKCGARTVHTVTEVFSCPMCLVVRRLKFDPRIQHVMALAERRHSAFSAVVPPKSFANLLALRPAEGSKLPAPT